MAFAMRSWSLREACILVSLVAQHDETFAATYFDRAENPENKSLHNSERRRTDAKGEVDTNVLANVRVRASPLVVLRPFLEQDRGTFVQLESHFSERLNR